MEEIMRSLRTRLLELKKEQDLLTIDKEVASKALVQLNEDIAEIEQVLKVKMKVKEENSRQLDKYDQLLASSQQAFNTLMHNANKLETAINSELANIIQPVPEDP